uniref:Uncharacterized protein n=1 Tax=Nelumbo nucifera TaxID=4432 RepID=A0A822ZFB3_NELNU|nr:TPA_asm: hypothetical protein HUJ06_000669 [Nelumbo nucifera]DAD42440.1 TPA_asm: hypothetical protein HUJ06_000670 [Nelumbo nucifera]DAD42441.1 TPA_asm: hypothetical protein HUJ06_000671 [Nelumbo nucifera]
MLNNPPRLLELEPELELPGLHYLSGWILQFNGAI